MEAPLLQRPRSLYGFRPVLLLLVLLGLVACAPSDPLAELRQRQAAGDFASTLDPLRQLVDQHPDSSETYYLYGRALAATGQTSLAEWPLRKAMEDPEWLVPAGIQLASGAIQTGNYNSAIEVTTRLLELEPDNVQVLLMRANAYANSRIHREEALKDVDRILEIDPDATDAMGPRIVALIGLDRIDEARQAIEDLGKRIEEEDLGPATEGWYCASTAVFADDSDDVELARERWEDCTKRFPDHPNVVEKAVEFYDKQGELDRSVEVLQAALEKSPASRGYRMGVAERLRKLGRRDEALALLKKATQAEVPQLAAVAWTDLAAFHSADGDTQAEAAAARKAVELARSVGKPHPELLLVYADAVLRAGNLDEALAAANEIEVPAYRELVLGRVAYAQDRPADAIQHYQESFRVWPDNPFARYYAALAYEALGDFDHAVAAYRYSIRISPGVTDARLRVGRLLAAQGRLKEANALLNMRRKDFPPSVESELLSLRLAARLGEAGELNAVLARFRRSMPGFLGLATANAAQGLVERAGPAAALRALHSVEGVDLQDPQAADALRAVVRFAKAAGQLDTARADVQAALKAHPDAAAFHEIQALLLEEEGAKPEEIRAAYEHALALDPDDAHALVGRARLTLAADPEGALADYEHAERSKLMDVALQEEASSGAVRALLALGRTPEAQQRLRARLLEAPYDVEAAEALAQIELQQGSPSDQTLELAQRAVHFGGGAQALDLLARVHQQRGEAEQATEAAARAQALRESSASGAASPRGEAG